MRSANRDENERSERKGIFRRSLAIRVVSTGCSACDLEVLAVNNPIFDIERFGINVVASPRFADALLITGPVPKAMHAPLLSCYEAMARPKIVIACGTCSISGGVHEGTYTEANGVTSLLPVDVFIPGCPPHPWQLVNGILAAQRLSLQGRTSL
jgi:Ni,Fe-hydrogenase III small subunit